MTFGVRREHAVFGPDALKPKSCHDPSPQPEHAGSLASGIPQDAAGKKSLTLRTLYANSSQFPSPVVRQRLRVPGCKWRATLGLKLEA